ncbi:hypothetical protein BT69DRAFT_1292066 [Atractiella rhizophila]|nr:hypothetical protein BT69DRAFT_1292066 [Atractiella rhizophila]
MFVPVDTTSDLAQSLTLPLPTLPSPTPQPGWMAASFMFNKVLGCCGSRSKGSQSESTNNGRPQIPLNLCVKRLNILAITLNIVVVSERLLRLVFHSWDCNPNFRPSPIEPGLKLINFDKYQKMSKIISDVQRFQVPYDLLEVKEVQQWISSHLNGLASGGDVGELYRRSLLLEPRADGSIPSSPNPANSGGKASDILNFNWR